MSCSPATCTGCCFNNVCQTGDTTAACGKNGLTCAVCGTGTICKADQTCGVDPEKEWNVHPTSATIAGTDENGSAWDAFGGWPDPFVNLYCPSSAPMLSAFTTPGTDTLTPAWPTGLCVMKTKDLTTHGFAFEVYDEDVSVPDLISAKKTVVVTEAQLVAGSISGITNAPNLTSLNVQVTPR